MHTFTYLWWCVFQNCPEQTVRHLARPNEAHHHERRNVKHLCVLEYAAIVHFRSPRRAYDGISWSCDDVQVCHGPQHHASMRSVQVLGNRPGNPGRSAVAQLVRSKAADTSKRVCAAVLVVSRLVNVVQQHGQLRFGRGGLLHTFKRVCNISRSWPRAWCKPLGLAVVDKVSKRGKWRRVIKGHCAEPHNSNDVKSKIASGFGKF